MSIIEKIFNVKKLKFQGIYLDGTKGEGEYKDWYSNGQLYKHCFYKDGKLHGEYKWWYSDGQLDTHCFYKDGKKVKEIK